MLLRTGHYAEARAAYQRESASEPAAAAIGIARCQESIGALDDALQTLTTLTRRHPDAAAAHAELARLEFGRGRYTAAQARVDTALRLVPDQPEARYFAAELHRVAGRLDQANDAYRWFVHFYNEQQEHIVDPEVLRWVGLAGAQQARWNRASSQFHFLVNTLYPDALVLDSLYWQAHLEAALLFIEKYNLPAATEEVNAGLAINPNAAELHTARAMISFQDFALDTARAEADRALAIDPQLSPALRLRSDVALVASGPRAAVADLERARPLDPADEATLGRLAAAFGLLDGMRDDPAGTRMGALIDEAVARNPHCGEFFATLAASLDLRFDYPDAARWYGEARQRMPQLVTVPGQLGLVAMRLGDEAGARTILKEAFEIDPFNIRIKNTLDVLEVLDSYATIETTHFILRFDRGRDSLLAQAASRWLEERVYPDDVKALRFEPPGKTLIEIFSSARGSSGHEWFSVRMVGLPFIGTVAACAGKMIAVTSPNDGPRPFNWARVLKHEFVHVINLQQTRFNIPRWFTEGLAVRLEGAETPGAWESVLARRLAAGRVFDLSTINLGFVRPRTGEDWTLAYAQSELYTRYMADTYGVDALNRMIAAYGDNLDTPAALQHCLGLTQESFEKGYRRYIGSIGGGDSSGASPGPTQTVTALEREAAKRPRDAALLARLARARLEEGRQYEAKSTAEQALAIDPRQSLAAFVVARTRLFEGNASGAKEALRAAFDPHSPDPEALALLVDLTLNEKDYAAAETLLTLGAARFPAAANWQAGLAAVYRGTGRTEKLAATLERQAGRDADDFKTRMELADLAAQAGKFGAAARWSDEALQIDVTDAGAHAALAKALAETHHAEQAADEYATAIALSADHLEWRLALAKAYAASGHKDRARQAITALLERDANYPGAREVLETLGH
jgi:tetratricopeptide (TPR) repeat protein